RRRRLLDERVPLLAIHALPLPTRRDGAAFGADVATLGFGHGCGIAERMGNASPGEASYDSKAPIRQRPDCGPCSGEAVSRYDRAPRTASSPGTRDRGASC